MDKIGDYDLKLGDCLEVLTTIPNDSIDSCITDPPYGLSFMGKDWDHGVPGIPYWREVLRVLKPGAFLLAFGGTRTSHRLTCAIEDAGFEIRDSMAWIHGQGFPKSLDIGKAIDKAAGAEREALTESNTLCPDFPNPCRGHPSANGSLGGGVMRHALPTAPATELAQQWDGYGTALKPAIEMITVAMKPIDGTFAANAEKWGVAGLWIDGGRIGAGRWPANLILDEAMAAMLDEQSGQSISSNRPRHNGEHKSVAKGRELPHTTWGHDDVGGASRFFYVAKASKAERGEGNEHPTVKPLTLMRYLCRLTRTPSGGVVLDPFMGSGTTGIAAIMEGRAFIGIEKHPPYFEIAKRRIAKAQPEPTQGTLL